MSAKAPAQTQSATLEKHQGQGYQWGTPTKIDYRATGNELELAIPRAALGLTKLPATLDFKWADNIQQTGDWSDFTLNDEAAPNDRFNYRAKLQYRPRRSSFKTSTFRRGEDPPQRPGSARSGEGNPERSPCPMRCGGCSAHTVLRMLRFCRGGWRREQRGARERVFQARQPRQDSPGQMHAAPGRGCSAKSTDSAGSFSLRQAIRADGAASLAAHAWPGA